MKVRMVCPCGGMVEFEDSFDGISRSQQAMRGDTVVENFRSDHRGCLIDPNTVAGAAEALRLRGEHKLAQELMEAIA